MDELFPTFSTELAVELDWVRCRKKPIIIRATQINTPFRVNTLEGNYKQGKAGDWLLEGIDKELYICDNDIFAKTYNILEEGQ